MGMGSRPMATTTSSRALGLPHAVGGPAAAPARLARVGRGHAAPFLVGRGILAEHAHRGGGGDLRHGARRDGGPRRDARAPARAGPRAAGLARGDGLSDWDAYEQEFSGSLERWVAVHPDDPGREALLAQAAEFRSTWDAWRRDAMGFVVALLRR